MENDELRRRLRAFTPGSVSALEAMERGHVRVGRLLDLPASGILTDEMRFRLVEGTEGLRKLAAGARTGSAGDEPLSLGERIGLEALIRLTGRPPLAIVDDTLDPDDPLAAEWGSGNISLLSEIALSVAPSVGRIDLNGRHVGTGFMVAPGTILTNRHVVEAIALPMGQARSGREDWVLFAANIWIDFKREKGSSVRNRFKIAQVICAGPDPIGGTMDFRKLDAALLRLEPAGLDPDGTLPPPLDLIETGSQDYEEGAEIATIGYPGRPNLEPQVDATPEDAEVARHLVRLFQSWWGIKRFSPGHLLAEPDGQRGPGWVLAHDSTTTGGASGSAVISLNGLPVRAVGLHFAGLTRKANYAHGLGAIGPALQQRCGVGIGYEA